MNMKQKLRKLLKTLDDEKKLELLSTLEESDLKLYVISKIEDDDKKIVLLNKVQELFKDEIEDENDELSFKLEVLERLSSDDKKIEIMESLDIDEEDRLYIIDTFKDKDKKITKLKEYGLFKEYRANNEFSKNLIAEYLPEFLEGEGIKFDKDTVMQMYQKNHELVKCDFRILDEKYIQIFGADKVNQMSCYSDVTKKVLSFDEKRLKVISGCLENYMQSNNTDEWNILADRLINNMDSYKELIDSIDNIDELDYELVTNVISRKNDLEIKDIQGLEKYYEIRAAKCDELIKSDSESDKKEAIFQKVFGQSLEESINIVYGYRDQIKDEDLASYLECIKVIVETDNLETLDLIYDECDVVKNVHPILMERLLKNEYAKEFNKTLFRIENAQELGENMYEAGTDFSMIITSIASYEDIPNFNKNYKNDWNRAEISTQHICTSYIRNDMLNTAPIYDICYGFTDMAEDSLILSGIIDIDSVSNKFVPEFLAHKTRYVEFRMPDEQIDNTVLYNEMDYKREQNGEKKQPDYIVVFKKQGKIENLERAKKASQDFGDLPIVVVDVEKCLESEKNKVGEMLKEYEETGDPEVAKCIYQKVRNNRLTNSSFCKDIELEMFQELGESAKGDEKEKKLTLEKLKNIYKQNTPYERNQAMLEILEINKRVQNVLGGEVFNDERK